MNSIIINKSYKFSIILIASLVFVLFSSDHSIGENYKETVNYSYDGIDIKLKFEEQRFIHLSLPADEYIMRLRSKGSNSRTALNDNRKLLFMLAQSALGGKQVKTAVPCLKTC